ncbi:MAG TPA: FHA domain-containing protein [Tetrasphaera sp.]|jgi:pSer/pThr/pTyr-binding forkhead associated (FHA) protein|nr:FHA domain-containing protein [Tetrasphaera sp.]
MSDTGPDEISVAPQPDDTGHHLGARFDPSTQRLPSAAGAEPADWSDYEPALSREDIGLIEALRPGTALLIVQRGPNAGARFLLDNAEVTSGRGPDSDIFLDDVTVSRKHAVFTWVDDHFVVRDVGSLNGTYVNRERVDTANLADRDEVQIGKFRLVFHQAKG